MCHVVYQQSCNRSAAPSFQCTDTLIFDIIAPHMTAFCKAEEEGDVGASLTDDNAADVVIGGAIVLIINVSVH